MVVVGRFGPPFGIRGWLNVISYTEPVTNLLDYRPWFIEQRDGWTALAVGDLKPHRKGFIAQIDGITDRDEALRLAGRPIGVADDALPATADDEFYWKDLIGMKVQDRSGQVLGEVTGLI
jgi:16S rRNA processing protein RimM